MDRTAVEFDDKRLVSTSLFIPFEQYGSFAIRGSLSMNDAKRISLILRYGRAP